MPTSTSSWLITAQVFLTPEIRVTKRSEQGGRQAPVRQESPPRVLDCRANAKFYSEFFRSQNRPNWPGNAEVAPKADSIRGLISKTKDGLSEPADFFHAYYAKLNSPHLQQNEFVLGVNGNLNFHPKSLNPRFQMNVNRSVFGKKQTDSREELIRRMYNPHMINRNYVEQHPRNTLKSEMQNLTKMLNENLF